MRDIDRALDALAALQLNGANKRLAAHWLSRWHGDKPPTRERFAMKKVWEFDPAIAIFEVRKGESVRCVASGSFHKLALGYELAGEDVLSLTAAGAREQRLAACWEIVEGAVSVSWRTYKSVDGSFGLAQCTTLPLSDMGADGARLFLKHSNWRPVASDWTPGNVEADANRSPKRLLVSFKQPPVEAAA